MDRPRRVVITHSRTTSRRRSSRTSAPRDLAEHTIRGEVLLAALRRSQLRLAISIATAFILTVAAIPLVYYSFPVLADLLILGTPVLWFTFGFAIFPLIVLLGWIHVRATERYEQAFTDLIKDV
jgi:TRAP-type C4-dicarboxylate transport system permease small subunit